jgi:NTP pyrophosphatase (non-canonical NTP hydrolase)
MCSIPQKGVEHTLCSNEQMELENIVNDTQHFTQRIQELLGPHVFGDPSTLVVELSRVIGVLAESTLVTEGKRPAHPARSPRLAHDVADVLFLLIAISNHYHIDLEKAWNEWIPQTRARLSDDAFVQIVHDRVARARQQKAR